jgi:DNA-binding MarR family transcriptional regulator
MVASNRQPAPDGLSALFDVFVLAQAVHELLADALAGAPLTPAEYAVSSQLLSTPGCTPTELAQALAAPLTTVSDWVRTFTQRGLVARERRVADGRSYGIVLTAAGHRAHRTTNQLFEQANALFLAGLPRPESELRTLLTEAAVAATSARATIHPQAAAG